MALGPPWKHGTTVTLAVVFYHSNGKVNKALWWDIRADSHSLRSSQKAAQGTSCDFASTGPMCMDMVNAIKTWREPRSIYYAPATVVRLISPSAWSYLVHLPGGTLYLQWYRKE